MIINYLKIALRNLLKYKSFSLINIIGLAVGITCFIVLALFIIDEMNYDTCYENADQIYRLYVHADINGQESCNSKTGAPLGAKLKSDFPEIITYSRLGYSGSHVFQYEDKVFREWQIYTADSTYFSVFNLNFIDGDKNTALIKPNSLVVTKSAARRYLGDENPVGKVLTDKNLGTCLITGLIEDFPKKSHFSCDFLLSMSTYPIADSQYWLDLWYTTYIVLSKDVDPAEFEKKLSSIVLNEVGPQAEIILGTSMDDFIEAGNSYEYKLQPLKTIYLQSKQTYNIDPNTEWSDVRNSDLVYIYLFSGVAILILFMAVINFMNLTTARSENRAKEVGIRKTLGTNKIRLILQFILESIIVTGFAVILSLMLTEFVLPAFNNFTGKHLDLNLINHPLNILILVVFTILVGTLAGSYPALYLSSFQAVKILKSNSGRTTRKSALRSILVITQFAISIILIIGSIVIKNQIHFIQNKNLGFNKEHLLTITNANVLRDKMEIFRQELSGNPGVISVTNSSRLFDTGIPGNGFLYDRKYGTNPLSCQFIDVDYSFLETFQIPLKEGRFFSKEFPSDSTACVINEAAMDDFDATDPVGREITKIGIGNDAQSYRIIGVMKNFNYESLHQSVRPLILHLSTPQQAAYNLTIRVSYENLPSTIAFIEKTWNKFSQGENCHYDFVDRHLNRLYESEERTGFISSIFSLLAIFIACLGLFGLSAFVIEQRIKEIGIRKVLGASVREIIYLLSKDFSKWVILSNLIAWPLAWILLSKWLQNFAYRIELSWWIFLISGAVALIIALLTVSTQAVKVAFRNPVEVLKYE